MFPVGIDVDSCLGSSSLAVEPITDDSSNMSVAVLSKAKIFKRLEIVIYLKYLILNNNLVVPSIAVESEDMVFVLLMGK